MGFANLETIAALAATMTEAKTGRLTGVVVVEFYDAGYRVKIAGSAIDDPALVSPEMLQSILAHQAWVTGRIQPSSASLRE